MQKSPHAMNQPSAVPDPPNIAPAVPTLHRGDKPHGSLGHNLRSLSLLCASVSLWFSFLFLIFALLTPSATADTLAEIQARGKLIWGGDAEGGGPYVYPDPAKPRERIGFEVDLAAALAEQLGVKAQFMQGGWDDLPALLETRAIDMVLNGYELTAARAGRMRATSPYYVFRFVLMAPRKGSTVHDWADLHAGAGGRKPRVGVLSSSGAFFFMQKKYGDQIDLKSYDANTDALREVETGKLDATVVDLPIAQFYGDQFAGLEQAGEPIRGGVYVAYVRLDDERLCDALNQGLADLLKTGRLREIYQRYGLWNADQDELAAMQGKSTDELGIRATRYTPWQVFVERGPLLLDGAWMTVKLACLSMPLAIVVGLAIALGRLYGPAPMRWLLVTYVEVIRGTPLLLQLYVIFYLLPQIGLVIRPMAAAILGLAINYSAYESEIYRAGLRAVPRGQMEAALALGMTTWQALRRIIVPQAVRIVIPPVTNDFIALFKDTSMCSIITVMELTGAYRQQRNDTQATIVLAVMTGTLYLLMSVPLSHVASRLEKRMRQGRSR
jgi:polar amino acid transport system substrate-binding protein